MAEPTPAKVLRIALFTLVPAAWFSVCCWQSYGQMYSPDYSVPLQWMCMALMAAVLLVSLLSWLIRQNRLLSFMGFIICFLWLIMFLLPTL